MAADTPRITRASEALSGKFAVRHGAQKDCADRTGIPQSRLSRIAAGLAFPRADEGARLVEEGIPIHWWNEPSNTEEGAQQENPAKPAA